MKISGDNQFRILIGTYSFLILFIYTLKWFYSPSGVSMETPIVIEYAFFKTIVGPYLFLYIFLVISLSLTIICIYRENLYYLSIAMVLLYTLALIFTLYPLLTLYSVPIEVSTTYKMFYSLSIDLVNIIVLNGIFMYFKPYFVLRTSKVKIGGYGAFHSIFDLSSTSILLLGGVILLSQIPYILTSEVYDQIYLYKEKIINTLGSMIFLILTYPLTYIIIYIGMFLFILYLFMNVVEPSIIYLMSGKGQAISILKGEREDEYMKELSYVRDTDKYIYIGLALIALMSAIVLSILISKYGVFILSYLQNLLSDLIYYRHSVEPTSVDGYINSLINQRIFEEYIAKILRFLRFIISLLF